MDVSWQAKRVVSHGENGAPTKTPPTNTWHLLREPWVFWVTP